MSDYAFPPPRAPRCGACPTRGVFDRPTVFAILDEALVCHVGFVADGQPFVIPTIYARGGGPSLRPRVGGQPDAAGADGEHPGLRHRDAGGRARPRALRFPPFDELPLGGGPGSGPARDDPAEKAVALEAVVEHVVPGRSADVRGPNEKELLATSVLRLDLEEVSAKVRTGPPIDDRRGPRRSPAGRGSSRCVVTAQAPVPDPQCGPASSRRRSRVPIGVPAGAELRLRGRGGLA